MIKAGGSFNQNTIHFVFQDGIKCGLKIRNSIKYWKGKTFAKAANPGYSINQSWRYSPHLLMLSFSAHSLRCTLYSKMASNGLKMRNSTRQYLPSLDAINKGGEGISMLVYVFFLGWLEKCKIAFFAQKRQHFILTIFLLVVEFEILCITTKPYILQKILFPWFC